MMCADRGAVDVVDHRRQRRALAAARRAGHQHQPALFRGHFLQDRWQPQLVDPAHADRNDAQDHPDGAALLEDVAAEAAEAGHAVGEVDLLRVLEPSDGARPACTDAAISTRSVVDRASARS